jgi:hypothetical protein
MPADEGLEHSPRRVRRRSDGQGAIAPDAEAKGLAACTEDQLEGEIIDAQTGHRDAQEGSIAAVIKLASLLCASGLRIIVGVCCEPPSSNICLAA